MDIKNWLLDNEQVESEYSASIKKLLSLYVQALHEFFNIEHETKNINELLVIAEGTIEKKSEALFFGWLKDTGLNQVHRIWSLNLPFDSTVSSKIKYVTGTLKDELLWEDRTKKSTRSCIVNTLTHLYEELIRLSNLALTKEKVYGEAEYLTLKKKNVTSETHFKPLETVVIFILKKWSDLIGK